MSPWTINDDTV